MNVLLDLLHQQLDAGEGSLISKAMEEAYSEGLTIQVVGEIEEVYFNSEGSVGERGTVSDVCDATVDRVVVLHLDSVDSCCWDQRSDRI